MTIHMFFLLGALGGSFRGIISLYGDFATWHQARRSYCQRRNNGMSVGQLPRLAAYIDPLPEVSATVVHILLGGLAGSVFGATGQIAGVYATVLVGASAPALLTQMGQFKFVREAIATSGGGEQADTQLADAVSPRVPSQEVPPDENLTATPITHGSPGERTEDDI